LDGNKRIGLRPCRPSGLNGFDLDVGSHTAYEFMVRSMEYGKFRFALIREWIAALLTPLEE
jgi:hypothetical protein